MKRNVNQILEKLSTDIVADLKDIVIFYVGDDYELFQKYRIKKLEHGYQVTLLRSDTVREFLSLKTAVTWCIYDYYHKIFDANMVSSLEQTLGSLEFKIKVQEKIFKKHKNVEDRVLYQIKIQENIRRKSKILKELNELVQNAHYLQRQKYVSKSKLSA
jgi:hypothetical protein